MVLRVKKIEDVAESVAESECSWMKVESRIDMYATREDRINSVVEQASHSTGFFSSPILHDICSDPFPPPNLHCQ